MVRKVTGLQVPKSPPHGRINFPVKKASKSERHLIHLIFLGAKLIIARALKQPPVSCTMAKKKILWIMAQEKRVSILQDTVQMFEATWETWPNFIHIFLTPS